MQGDPQTGYPRPVIRNDFQGASVIRDERGPYIGSGLWTILWFMPQTDIASEGSITRSIMHRLEREDLLWIVKFHGSALTRAGVPDLLGCHRGRFFALEVKRPHVGRVAPIQRYVMQKIANAGGLVAVVESVDDALRVLGLQ